MKLNSQKLFLKSILFIFSFLFVQHSTSQNLYSQKNLDSVFVNFTKPFKEVVYTHINKTKYIKGETLGFSSYVFNQKSKKLTTKTSNLYCIISDSKDSIIEKKLVKVENGIANGTFKLSSKFNPGNYTIKTYTSWMLNFSKENIFVESFKIINLDAPKNSNHISSFDIQLMPESGHLLHNVSNTIGVVVKDSLGYGIPFLKGFILNANNNKISSFKVNSLGIGRFSFVPKIGETYKIKTIYKGVKKEIVSNLKIDSRGVILKINQNKNNLIVSAVTNDKTLINIKNKKYKVVFHDGNKLRTINFNFNSKNTFYKLIDKNSLSKGVTIFTLFDSNNNPIAERLFFNYKNLKIIDVSTIHNTKVKDSVTIDLKFNNSINIGFNNVSVSILPKGTISNNKNTNMMSQVLLKPFVRGLIENSNYYFTNITKQKKYDLDNLLITQGWSSYSWHNMFNYKNNYTYKFEKGITAKINAVSKDESNRFLIHKLLNRDMESFSLNNQNSYVSKLYYPTKDEKLYISKLNEKGKLYQSKLYIQYSPNNIPSINKKIHFLVQKNNYFALEEDVDFNAFYKLNKGEVLDEIVIKTDLEKVRREKIKNENMFSKVYFIDVFGRNQTLAQFLNFIPGYKASDGIAFEKDNERGKVALYNYELKVRETITGRRPAIFIDGVQIQDYTLLYRYFLDDVDYIDVNRFNLGGGMNSNGGVIKIKTDPFRLILQKKTVSEYIFPVTFSSPSKKFYIPKYENYNSTFYKKFGVIDWLPINQIDENGILKLKVNNIKTNNITLFLEGTTENGEFIFDVKNVKLK